VSEITPISPKFELQVLSAEQLEEVREASLFVLEEVGVRFPSAQALEVFAAHGARIDEKSQVVRIPAGMVADAVRRAPRTYPLSGREAGTELLLDGSRSYFTTDGSGVRTIDLETGTSRASCKADVAMMARVADSLSAVAFYWPMVSAQDYGALAPLHELEASFNNTVKHVQSVTAVDVALARDAVRMAEVIAGSRERLRQAPPLSALICSIAPLCHDREGIEAALVYAKAGVPVGLMSMPCLGSTAPASVGGALVQATAEILSGLVLIQLVAPGAPVFYSIVSSVMHPRTAEYINAIPEKFLVHCAAVQIGHDWGVPVLAGGFGAPGEGPPGWRYGRDSVYTALLTALAGADMVVGLGLRGASTLLAFEQIILDEEIYHINRALAGGVNLGVDGEALDAIRAVGPGGHFLSQDHTRRKVREIWIPSLSHHGPVEGSEASSTAAWLAREQLLRILREHAPAPLERSKQDALKAIIEAAARARA
jgi:trimethylamine--corrinoid protein Co-methyltransferase